MFYKLVYSWNEIFQESNNTMAINMYTRRVYTGIPILRAQNQVDTVCDLADTTC